MIRPSHLPVFSNPPLDEVVLGIQFTPVSSYTSVHGNDVWALFREEFPLVQEHPALEPKFETFGGVNPTSGIDFLSALHPREGVFGFFLLKKTT